MIQKTQKTGPTHFQLYISKYTRGPDGENELQANIPDPPPPSIRDRSQGLTGPIKCSIYHGPLLSSSDLFIFSFETDVC